MLVVSSSGVFTHKSLRSKGDRFEATMEDDLNYLVLVNICPILVNMFSIVDYGRTKHIFELLGCGLLLG